VRKPRSQGGLIERRIGRRQVHSLVRRTD